MLSGRAPPADLYRQLLDRSSDPIFCFAPDFRYLYANQAFADGIGKDLAEILDRTLWEVFPKDEADKRATLVNRVFEHGEAKSHELLVKGRNGARHYLTTITPLFGDQGQVSAVLANSKDITKRKQAEIVLKASEEKYRALVETTSTGYLILDREGMVIDANSEYVRLSGYSDLLEILGRSVLEWTAEYDLERNGKAVARCVRDGFIRNLVIDYVDRNGRTTPIEINATANDQGDSLQIIALCRDITERKLAEKDRRDHHELLQAILATALDGFWLADTQGRLLDVNDAACAMLGYTKQEALGLSVSDIDALDSQEEIENRAQRMKLDGGDQFESRHRRKDGCIIDVEVSIRYLPLKSAFSVFVRDITQRKLAEAKIQLAASVFGHAREGITITNAQGSIIDVNEAFTRITGYSREECMGKNPRMLSSGRQDKAFYESMWKDLLTVGHWSGELWNRRKNGEVYAELITISAVRDAQGKTQQYVALFSDITAIKEHQNKLDRLAHFDALTGLPNRLLLADRMQQGLLQAARRGQTLAVAYLDLDGFKAINDQHGHDVGDQLLIALANRMKQALREGDTLARMGGDEFVAVLTDLADAHASAPLLNRLLMTAGLPVAAGNLSLQVSTSLGVTFYPQEQGIAADQLLRQADHAMYQAKLAGKNRVHVFDATQNSGIRAQHESKERIRLALENSEFVLHYQPKVNMHSGQVIGAEALLRWQHPERGLLTPIAFLPVIEDHPLAVEVGEWVIDSALTQIGLWRAAGLDLSVSVNIGARQLQQANFVQQLQAILAKHPQVKPSSLELEVQETNALADMTQVSKVLEDCAKMGMKSALDDFGTGYSSLTHLKRLRVALLKIDQSVVRGMLDNPDDLAILQGVIGMAAAFKREVIAEGVETVAQGTLLLQMGCHLAQGYGIARPMPPEQMSAWVATWRQDAAWSAVLNPGEASRFADK